jgi:hypothetical protein
MPSARSTTCGKRLRVEAATRRGPNAPGPAQAPVRSSKGDAAVFPPAKVHTRLTNGSEDNVWFYFQVLMEKHWK